MSQAKVDLAGLRESFKAQVRAFNAGASPAQPPQPPRNKCIAICMMHRWRRESAFDQHRRGHGCDGVRAEEGRRVLPGDDLPASPCSFASSVKQRAPVSARPHFALPAACPGPDKPCVPFSQTTAVQSAIASLVECQDFFKELKMNSESLFQVFAMQRQNLLQVREATQMALGSSSGSFPRRGWFRTTPASAAR